MAGEQIGTDKPLTKEELRAKYVNEAEREYDGLPPWGGEREERFETAYERVAQVLFARGIHQKLQDISDGQAGVLSESQVEAINDWEETNAAVLGCTQTVVEMRRYGTATGFVESQVFDLEAVAANGLDILRLPEDQQ